MKNIIRSLLEISAKHVMILALFGIMIYVVMYQREGFLANGWNLSSSTMLENAHGSAPAGVNASPGMPQYVQDSASPPVNPANKKGNPQNTNPEYKKQPMFVY